MATDAANLLRIASVIVWRVFF